MSDSQFRHWFVTYTLEDGTTASFPDGAPKVHIFNCDDCPTPEEASRRALPLRSILDGQPVVAIQVSPFAPSRDTPSRPTA